MLPKKLQLKDVPKSPEFAGRDVWRHTAGDNPEAFKANYQKLSDQDYNGLRMHAGGYYSIPKKTKKTK